MSGSTFGKLFRVTTFGESHGVAVGCIVDGCPAGLALSEEDIQIELDKRKPGAGIASTKRAESDSVKILSGVFEGKTTGTPIALIVYNEDQRSKDYSAIAKLFRPGHADYTFFKKYGFRDYRGGGRSSGRETVARVAAGAIAKKLLLAKGISVLGFVRELGGVRCEKFTQAQLAKAHEHQLRMPDPTAAKKAEERIKAILTKKDSLGGIIEVIAQGVPAGLGEPVFDKLDAQIAGAVMSIGAVKGVEIGAGFSVAASTGSKNNDAMRVQKGNVVFLSNNAGGILGGMSSGADIVVRAAVKPTSSIPQKQKTISEDMRDADIEVLGRHDVCIAPRIVAVAEAMVALVLINALLEQSAARL